MTKINEEQAREEWGKWLNHKKISERVRRDNESYEDLIVDEIMEGNLVVDEEDNFKLKYTLKFPISDDEGSPFLAELTIKPRVMMRDIDRKMKGVKPGDFNGMIRAYASAISDTSPGKLGTLEDGDYKVINAITSYFL